MWVQQPAERVAGDLRHREQLQHVGVEAEQAARREVGDDVVVEDGREERRAEELDEGDVRVSERGDAAAISPCIPSKNPASSAA